MYTNSGGFFFNIKTLGIALITLKKNVDALTIQFAHLKILLANK